jgi:hypothetical protein
MTCSARQGHPPRADHIIRRPAASLFSDRTGFVDGQWRRTVVSQPVDR